MAEQDSATALRRNVPDPKVTRRRKRRRTDDTESGGHPSKARKRKKYSDVHQALSESFRAETLQVEMLHFFTLDYAYLGQPYLSQFQKHILELFHIADTEFVPVFFGRCAKVWTDLKASQAAYFSGSKFTKVDNLVHNPVCFDMTHQFNLVYVYEDVVDVQGIIELTPAQVREFRGKTLRMVRRFRKWPAQQFHRLFISRLESFRDQNSGTLDAFTLHFLPDDIVRSLLYNDPSSDNIPPQLMMSGVYLEASQPPPPPPAPVPSVPPPVPLLRSYAETGQG